MSVIVRTVLLLSASNVFMTFAWYALLKNLSGKPWYIAALVSWGVALAEYLLQVPANRMGHQHFTAPQLKGIQESLSILTFFAVSTLWLGEGISLKQMLGFALMIVAAVLIVGD